MMETQDPDTPAPTEGRHPDTPAPLRGPLRVGIDVVEVARLEERLRRWPRLSKRLFTERERVYASARRNPAEHLAARFAAKEATFKALGTGWPSLSWLDVEVISGKGRPQLFLRGPAAHLAGDYESAVSLSHDGGYALAQVVLVARRDGIAGPAAFPKAPSWPGTDFDFDTER